MGFQLLWRRGGVLASACTRRVVKHPPAKRSAGRNGHHPVCPARALYWNQLGLLFFRCSPPASRAGRAAGGGQPVPSRGVGGRMSPSPLPTGAAG